MPVHLSHHREAQWSFRVLALMGLLLLASLLLPLLPVLNLQTLMSRQLGHYLPLHMALETLAIAVATMAFATAWSAPWHQQSRTSLLSPLFLGVALLDFSHMLSYQGMPDFVTPSGSEKAINFWLAARVLAAVSLLLAAAQINLRAGRLGRWLSLALVLLVVVGLHLLFLGFPHWLPRTFIEGQGLTPFKLAFEYGLIGAFLLAALGFAQQLAGPRERNASALLAVALLMAMSEFFFTLYSQVEDAYNLLGHLYKVAAYVFFYRAVVWEAVKAPYDQLQASKQQLEQQQEETRKLSQAVEQSPFPIVITDRLAAIEYVNAAFERTSGYQRAEVLGNNSRMFQSGKTTQATYQSMWRSLLNDQPWEGKVINRHKDGSEYTERTLIYPILDDSGQVSHYLAHKEDITEQLATAQRIEQLSRYDTLTGLGNLAMVSEALQQGLNQDPQQRAAPPEPLAVLWLDLDRFKDINDIFGHDQGNRLLQVLADRCRGLLRPTDILCRHSGDTFIAVLRRTDETRAGLVASRLLEQIAQPLQLQGHSLAITASAGIALTPEDGNTPELLLAKAESAMYQSKQQGYNSYRFFTAELQQASVRLLELRLALQQAVEKQQLHLVYQPQLNLQTGTLSGVEVLVRWTHPKYGMINPAEFIPLAEDSGLIVPIGEWVATTALQQYGDWQAAGLPAFTLAINLSAVQFALPSLVENVCRWAEDAGVAPRQVELELTEAIAMANPDAAADTIRQLASKGFLLAIDDFGTGYSSLSYLKRFAIQRLKIDQSFVRDIDTNPNDRAIVSAIIQMARSLGLSTIAEGVETREQQELLQAEGCQQVQGYLYSRPLAEAELEAFVRAQMAVSADEMATL